MPSKTDIERALKQVHDEGSFFRILLSDTLSWPTQDVNRIEDIAYGWSGHDLNAANLEKTLINGSIWQMQPAEEGQPWGIFVLEFKHPDILTTHRGMRGVLRTVLRGLVASRRKEARLPSWKKENLLFICTHAWQSFRFAYFRENLEDSKASRLTTFGWAPGTSNRTVCEFNLPALVWPDDPADGATWVKSWQHAFNKEPLTKDFFKRFDRALEAIKSDLEKFQGLTSASAYTQAQLLLERLIFLYFLQNRGWLDRERRYLPDRFAEHLPKRDAFSFYGDFLDKLFWTLSSAPGEAGRLPGVPFLNGGLFDDDEFRQPGILRKTNPPLKVKNSTFEVVFRDLLEAFNFTVTEDTPLNEEVAVDPEMLGKVFESIVLHAEAADPDAVAPDKRKATGSYYTPRIVVHFICRETLYQHLRVRFPGNEWSTKLRALVETDASDGLDEAAREQLKRIVTPEQAAQLRDLVEPLKCCDPAVGSGAFPVGLLHELVNLRRLLTTAANGYVDPVRREGSTWLHETKAAIVQNCLFGVDIQQQAIEICRLRLWLGLIVDYDLGLEPFTAERHQFNAAIDRISQLPNLEMNFHRGDSLHDYICGVPVVILRNSASHYALLFRSISKLGQELHKAKQAERKKKLRLDILEKRLELSQRILDDAIRALRTQDSALDNFFGLADSAAKKRERLSSEIERLDRALKKVEADRKEAARLKGRAYDRQFYPKLRKLEGADFDSPFNFAWTVDFPGIFGGEESTGFDIIVGNPPFVTARNQAKRELYRERWPRVCYKNYLLVCPFFDLSFGLLKPDGQLGFIVSNAFAKREFGKPLVEGFFPSVDIQKIVDCSGLMFPGHGTPTCIVFGRQPEGVIRSVARGGPARLDRDRWKERPVRVAAILPGGGDLRTPPEESGLWLTLSQRHDQPGFSSAQVVVSDRGRRETTTWPWSFTPDESGMDLQSGMQRLADFCSEPIGAQFITGKDEVFVQPAHYFRRLGMPREQIRAYGTGEDIRNWSVRPSECIVFPYDEDLNPLREPLPPALLRHLRPYKAALEDSIISGSTKKKETKLKWFEFRRLARAKFAAPMNIVVPQISTHAHFVPADHSIAFKEKAQAIVLNDEAREEAPSFAVLGLLNTSLTLERLKRECFNKGAGSDEEKDRYEFSGGKLEDVPIHQTIAAALSGKAPEEARRLAHLSQRCCELGQKLRALEQRKLFQKPGEAYEPWNRSMAGYVEPHPDLNSPFEDADGLRANYNRGCTIHSGLRREMIALQEEMDWLVYAAYRLLPDDHPAVQLDPEPAPLGRDERPFALWARARGNLQIAETLIPSNWPTQRKALWVARLSAIRDDENVSRIEQRAYKRRWEEQWKVGAQWRDGAVAYAAEFVAAFEWWLCEKAEWWLDRVKKGGPVEFADWALALWKDPRVQAAWSLAAENIALVEQEKGREKAQATGDDVFTAVGAPMGLASFSKVFKRMVDDETVPEGIPAGVPYEVLEEELKIKVSARAKSVRGKLNVPRERFNLRDKTTYIWAGLQFRK